MKQRILKSIFFILILFLLYGCANKDEYIANEAVEKGDIISKDEIINLGRFQQFTKNLSHKNEDQIRIISYTLEGEPIIRKLKFNGKSIHYSFDNSKDSYGGVDRGIHTDICKKITEKKDTKKFIHYYISDCTLTSRYVLLKVEK